MERKEAKWNFEISFAGDFSSNVLRNKKKYTLAVNDVRVLCIVIL